MDPTHAPICCAVHSAYPSFDFPLSLHSLSPFQVPTLGNLPRLNSRIRTTPRSFSLSFVIFTINQSIPDCSKNLKLDWRSYLFRVERFAAVGVLLWWNLLLVAQLGFSEMKIQCDVCEKRSATVICCADEAALCAKCDVEVHAANKLASKHQRLQLHSLSNKLPSCDICQEKAAFIFCVEDRALFCRDCDQTIHLANSLAGNHQRYLATGIRVALGSKCTKEAEKNCIDPSNQNAQQISIKPNVNQPPTIPSPGWAVDDLLEFSEFESANKKGALELGEMDWWSDVSLFGEQIPHEALVAAEVPQIRMPQPYSTVQSRAKVNSLPNKKPRFEIQEDDEEFFIVPDLG